MTSPEMPHRTMASPEVSSGMMISPEVPCEMTAAPFEAMAGLSMMKLSDVMLVEMSKVAFAKMALPEMMISSEVPCEMTAAPFEAMAAFSMMKLSDVMLVEMSKVAFAKMALPEMMTPAVFKMTPVGIRGIIPIGGAGQIDIIAYISEIIITAIRSRCIIKYFFGPFYCLLRFALDLL